MTDLETLKDDRQITAYVGKLIDGCEQYSDEQKPEREKALEYYDGKIKDLPAEKGFSPAVSHDLRATIKKMMPSIMRTLLSNDRIVEFGPTGPGDEEGSDQATDYMNHVVVPETDAETALYDAIFDTLTVKTGILKWVAYKRKFAKVHEYTSQTEEALLGLDGEEGVEVFDVVETPETDQDVLQLDPDAKRISFKLRRIEEKVDIRLQAIPRGSFLILPGHTIETSPIVGDREIATRSDLVSRGYDLKAVMGLATEDGDTDDTEDREAREGDDHSDVKIDPIKSMQQVLLYQVYVRLDADGDGIAELYKMCLGERGDEAHLSEKDTSLVILAIEPVDEAPYAEVVAEREAHAFEGHAPSEDVMPIMRIKTALLREGLDNVYWQNKPQPGIDPKKLTQQGLDAVFNPAFGKPIELRNGARLEDAVQWQQVPFFADKSFEIMGYLDEEIQDRTGATDQSGGLDPEAFQNMAATSANILSESGIAQVAMTIRNLSRGGIKRAFRGLLRLVIAHTDKPRTLRLRKDWVDYDPRYWDADMDCTVNIGLGAGSRERDLTVLQLIYNMQKEMLEKLGAENPYVKPDQLFNTVEKIVETAGFPSVDPYFTRPDPAEVQNLLNKAGGPSETEIKAQTQMQIEQVKAQARERVEAAQMEADLRVRAAETESNAKIEILKADHNRELTVLKEEMGLLKHREELQFKREQAGLAPPSDGPFNQGDLFNAS